jgi:hypothetical protein
MDSIKGFIGSLYITSAAKYLKVVIPAEAGIQKTLDAGSSPA